MANIMITDRCNLNCNYCFANQFVNNNKPNDISKESFVRILDFIETSTSEEHAGIIGGEPTMHPEFRELLSIVSGRERIKEVIVFTNGLLMKDYFEELRNPKISVLVNINSPSIIGSKCFNIIKDNIRMAIDEYGMKERTTIGVNIFSSDIDYGYIIDLIEEFEFDHLRISVTVPNKENDYEPIQHYKQMKEVVIDLIEKSLRHNAMPYFDCNKLPVCILTNEDRKNIVELCGDKPVSNIISEFSNCSPVLDILQDETCVRCFGLSEYMRVEIAGFDTINDLRRFFENQIDDFAHKTYYNEQCDKCYERVCKKCSGGCLKYKIEDILNY